MPVVLRPAPVVLIRGDPPHHAPPLSRGDATQLGQQGINRTSAAVVGVDEQVVEEAPGAGSQGAGEGPVVAVN